MHKVSVLGFCIVCESCWIRSEKLHEFSVFCVVLVMHPTWWWSDSRYWQRFELLWKGNYVRVKHFSIFVVVPHCMCVYTACVVARYSVWMCIHMGCLCHCMPAIHINLTDDEWGNAEPLGFWIGHWWQKAIVGGRVLAVVLRFGILVDMQCESNRSSPP